MTKAHLLLIVPLIVSLPLLAQTPAPSIALKLDPARTQVRYTLSDVLHTIHGTFVMKSGEVRFSPATGAVQGDIVIDAASGDSGNHKRDTRMKKDILEVKRFPAVHFLPRRVIGMVPSQGTGHFQVQGICRLHGSEHPLLLDVTATVAGGRFSGTTHFVIPYVEWGVKDPSTLFLRVRKQVIIDVTTAGTLGGGPETR